MRLWILVVAERFTWERKPFSKCPRCGEISFGFLNAGRDRMTSRCSIWECRYTESELLPAVDKKVIYLDQNAFSVLFKVQSGGRLPKGHEDFCRLLYTKLRRAVLLQQAVCPHSDIHSSETIVFGQAQGLRELYKGIGGDIAFKESDDVELAQTLALVRAYIDGADPQFTFDVDDILARRRNEWLPDMRITVNANYEQFAPGIRENRRQTHERMMALVAQWAADKPTFEEVREHELSVLGQCKIEATVRALAQYEKACRTGDIDALINSSMGTISRERMAIASMFERAGVAKDDQFGEVLRFWQWERNREQPSHIVFANLIAAVARRVALGQRKFSQGLMNDLRAISIYGPYVDAMFIDKEFANMLRETPQLRNLRLPARIFSFHDPEDFLNYLSEIEAAASAEQREYAARIYGIDRDSAA